MFIRPQGLMSPQAFALPSVPGGGSFPAPGCDFISLASWTPASVHRRKDLMGSFALRAPFQLLCTRANFVLPLASRNILCRRIPCQRFY